MPTREAQAVREQAALATERRAIGGDPMTPLRLTDPPSLSPSRAEAIREQAAHVAALLALPFLTAVQVATVVQGSASTIRRACAAGRLRAVRLGARQWRIEPAAIREWLGAREIDGRQPRAAHAK